MTLSSESYSNSAIVFSSSLLQRLEGHERLPTTYIGVRRVRDEDPPSTSSSRRRQPPPPPLARQDDVLAVATAEAVGVCSGGSNKEEGGYDEDDAWVPNELMTTCSRSGDENCTEILPPPPSSSSSIRLTDNQNEGENDEEENERTIQQNSKVAPIIFRITDPNDDSTTSTGRRMTSREKKQFKYQLKQAQQSVRKEERQRLHEQRIQEAKKEKAERKRVKRLAWQAKKLQQQLHQYEEQPQPQQQQQQQANDEQTAIATKMCNRMAKVPGKQVDHNIPKNDAPTPTSVTVPTAKRKGAGPAALPPTPAMLTPAATTTACLIRDLGLFLPPVTLHEQHSDNISSSTTARFRRRRTTIMDSDLSTQWANKLLHTALTPADVSRSKEEMRPMAYRLVPEVWARLCPDSLWTVEAEAVSTTTTMEDADAETAAANAVAFPNSSTEPNAEEGNTNINKKQTQIHEPREGTTTITTAPTFDTLPSPIATTTTTCYVPNHDYAFAQLRADTSSYDEDASLIVQHLHQYSNLYIACGAIFGCDLLLYDGPRDVRHSFAGVRIYCCKSRRRRSRTDGSDNMNEKEGSGSINDQLPIPSAYDMAGFVRTMNSARKIALLATVVRDVDDGGGNDVDNSPPRSMATTSKPTYRIAIVDLALEKVLSAPTHVRKGNTKKRRSEEDAANGLAK